MIGKVVDNPFDGFFDSYPVGVIERAPIDVALRQSEPATGLALAGGATIVMIVAGALPR